jgi:hypothetical protein
MKKKHRFRSGFELEFAHYLNKNSIKYEYERDKLEYIVDPKTYCPDFYLSEYDFYIETKGRLTSSDRVKHLYIKKQHPDVDIRFIFTNSRTKLRKGAKSSYAEWCIKYNFRYNDRIIPEDWLKEKGKIFYPLFIKFKNPKITRKANGKKRTYRKK